MIARPTPPTEAADARAAVVATMATLPLASLRLLRCAADLLARADAAPSTDALAPEEHGALNALVRLGAGSDGGPGAGATPPEGPGNAGAPRGAGPAPPGRMVPRWPAGAPGSGAPSREAAPGGPIGPAEAPPPLPADGSVLAGGVSGGHGDADSCHDVALGRVFGPGATIGAPVGSPALAPAVPAEAPLSGAEAAPGAPLGPALRPEGVPDAGRSTGLLDAARCSRDEGARWAQGAYERVVGAVATSERIAEPDPFAHADEPEPSSEVAAMSELRRWQRDGKIHRFRGGPGDYSAHIDGGRIAATTTTELVAALRARWAGEEGDPK